jgi:uncharacterized membrane protein
MSEPNVTGAATGLSDDAASGLAYFTLIPAIVFLVVAPYNQSAKVRFHAWQSIFLAAAMFVVYVGLSILGMIPGINLLDILLFPLVGIGFFVLWLITILQAFQGKRFRIPVLAQFAEKQAGGL